jgi:hypothetical protein
VSSSCRLSSSSLAACCFNLSASDIPSWRCRSHTCVCRATISFWSCFGEVLGLQRAVLLPGG